MRSFARIRGASLLLALTLPVMVASTGAQTPAGAAEASRLNVVLARARAAVSRYLNEAALLLADEQCQQKVYESVRDQGSSMGTVMLQRGTRRWQAEIALVPTPELAAGGNPWTEFRDVLIVDGHPVPDREERLSTVLRQQQTLPLEQARAITQQSARFNIGRERNTNTPSMPLLILAPSNARRFAFTATGDERVDGIGVLKVQFKEVRSPTLIKADGADCFATGSLWIATETGNVVQAEVRCGDDQRAGPPMVVRYRSELRLGLWVPFEMQEKPGEVAGLVGVTSVEGECHYSNYRRFETGAKLILK